ncbi:TPA: 3-oxoacyl-[acyl-carrier-protein] reductase [Candidatus Marinimicrobia bacterium]|nr:3-oxoacyl-[acyl-carrier-protein] reductase [Candidatus Neomarinimicrobiota bacterium]HBY17579.1 3-oxoacyl-[acyl-carrier-protein] reductase [Candidatus Neomarinimicrobiota bacterium]
MKSNLKDKNILISGASRGIGYAIAEHFLKSCSHVIIVGQNPGRLSEAAENLSTYGPVTPIVCDISESTEVENLFAEIKSRFSTLDCLVNAAGITRDQLAVRMKDSDWDAVIQVNLSGTFYMCRKAVRMMMAQQGGSVINISSVVGLHGNIGQANYSASKAGVIALTKTLARETAGKNIRVNAIAPGFIETDMTKNLPAQVKENFLNSIPMRRFGLPRDVSGLAVFLASEEAAYITGQTFVVDGGMSM